MKEKLALAVGLMLLCTAGFAQTTTSCDANRGRVRAGTDGSAPGFDPSNPAAKVISLSDFLKIAWTGSDPSKYPSKLNPETRVTAQEGTIYEIDNLDLNGFTGGCDGSVSIQFINFGDSIISPSVTGGFPSLSCTQNSQYKDAIATAVTNYTQKYSIWAPFDPKCSDGGDGEKNRKPLRIIGVGYWDDGGGFSTPILTLNPILLLEEMGGSGGNGGNGGTGGTPNPPVTPPDAAVVLPDALIGQALPMNPGGSGTYPINVQTVDGFTSDLTLSATTDAGPNSDFNVSVTPALIPAPGRGDATLNISVGPKTFPRSYYVNLIATTNEATPRTFSSGFLVNVICDPPMILGTAQPAAQSVARGATAQLTIPTPGGTGPFTYQWYLGHTGETSFPLTGATSQTLTTNPIFDNTVYYWVRASNACGTADSQTATVSVTGATPTNHRRTTGGH